MVFPLTVTSTLLKRLLNSKTFSPLVNVLETPSGHPKLFFQWSHKDTKINKFHSTTAVFLTSSQSANYLISFRILVAFFFITLFDKLNKMGYGLQSTGRLTQPVSGAYTMLSGTEHLKRILALDGLLDANLTKYRPLLTITSCLRVG